MAGRPIIAPVTSSVLPTAGGPDSEFGAAVARTLRGVHDSGVVLLHVADDRDAGEAFLRDWTVASGLGDAALCVETGAIEPLPPTVRC